METKLSVMLVVALCALIAAVGQIFFKLGSKTLTFNILTWLINWKLIIGLVLYAFATVLFVFSLKFGNLSTLYPIIAMSYIWVAVFSVVFLGETFTLFRWIGILFILIGIGVIVR